MTIEDLYYLYRDDSITLEEVIEALGKLYESDVCITISGTQWVARVMRFGFDTEGWRPSVREAVEHLLKSYMDLSKYPGLVAAAIKEARDSKNDL